MRNEIAEWVLSQGAPPEQAATIVGDLLEAELGPVAFWVAVLRVTVSIARHQPRRAFTSLFWLANVAAYYALLAWIITNKRLMHALGLWDLVIVVPLIFLGLVWIVWLNWTRRTGNLSPVISAGFTLWLVWHSGLGRFIPVMLLPSIAVALWVRWRFERRNPPADRTRPVAG